MARVLTAFYSRTLAWTLAAILSVSATAVAGINRWTALGPGAETVLDVLVDPLEPSVVHLGTLSGVWASADGGRSWELFSDLPAEVLGRSHQDRDRLYAAVGGGVFKSVDGGRSWTGPSNPMIAPPAFQWVSDLTVDPRDGDTVLVTGMAGRLLGMSPYVDVTHDGGATWRRRFGPGLEASEIVVDPQTPQTVYLAGLGVWRSADGGLTWEEVLEGTGGEEDYRSLSQLAIAPSDPRVLYASAIVDDLVPFGLWKSTDSGDTWEVPSAALDGVWVRDLAVAPDDPRTVYAATSDRPGPVVSGAVYVSRDGAVTWELLGGDLEQPVRSLAVNPLFPRHLHAGGESTGAYKLTQSLADGCAPGEALCLAENRFHVEVAWEDFQQRRGLGQPMPLTSDSGYLWFFDADNVEVVIKVLDGRGENGYFWVFSGALSDVGYTLQVTDVLEERVRTYRNPPHRFASFGDVTAFPAVYEVPLTSPPSAALPRPAAIFGCGDDPSVLCLGDRFELTVTWRDFRGRTGIGMPAALTADSGYFWFFDADNVELAVKVLDGKGINRHHWVFYGALSNVEFTLEITDHYTGGRRSYFNPLGTFASVGDIEAFPGDP